MNEYVERAQQYTRAVLGGAIPVCKWTRLAVQRQVSDLAREPGDDWPWVFDPDLAARPCAFIELLPHIKGKWAREGQRLQLEPWQSEAGIAPAGRDAVMTPWVSCITIAGGPALSWAPRAPTFAPYLIAAGAYCTSAWSCFCLIFAAECL